jgi:two-component system cell cycle sensor histidine kinase/response regulator CckA
MEKPLRILFLENVLEDMELEESALREAGMAFESRRAETREEFLDALGSFTPDAVLADFGLPSFTGIEALRLLREHSPNVPFLLVTGTIDEETALSCIKEGADDYLLKSNLVRLPPAVKNSLRRRQAESERERAIAELWRREEEYRLLFESNPQPMLIYDVESSEILGVNEAALRGYGYTREEFMKLAIFDLNLPGDEPRVREEIARIADQPRMVPGLWKHRRRDGSLLDVEITSHPVSFEGRRARLVLAIDVTERIRAREALEESEVQLLQAQKMEAVGRLAGGVAHDFNNLLTTIVGYSDMALERLSPEDPLRPDLAEIRKAGERGAALTRQLLAFSRKQVVETRPLDLNAVVHDVEKMLRRLIGEDLVLETRLASGLGTVLADPGQIEQVLMNLAVNARDAMPAGGRLTLRTANVDRDESESSGGGRNVLLEVADTGVGMDEVTKSHIFEPFFTTKEKGKGTGLGLATVYGIVSQLSGHIEVESSPGEGAAFRIYLPRTDETRSPAPAGEAGPAAERKRETILLVEDEDPVRNLLSDVLKKEGFEVLAARDAEEAMEVASRHVGPIALMVTDMIMPGMSGSRLARRLAETRKDMKVLYISGYIDDTMSRRSMSETHAQFIQKPFRPDVLVRKVRELLAGSP